MHNIKQVIIVRKDLNMRKGKMIAQGAHASMKVFFDKAEVTGYKDTIDNFKETKYEMKIKPITKEMKEWMEGNFKKIVVGCDSEVELMNYEFLAKDANIPCALIEDNGLTEFDGIKTKTALAIGPAESTKIDEITKNLNLL